MIPQNWPVCVQLITTSDRLDEIRKMSIGKPLKGTPIQMSASQNDLEMETNANKIHSNISEFSVKDVHALVDLDSPFQFSFKYIQFKV